MRRKIKFWCLLFTILLITEVNEDVGNVRAADVDSRQLIIQNEIK